MALTFQELEEELRDIDEVTLLEILHITSEDIIQAFQVRIEEHQEELEQLIKDNKEGLDFYDYDND